MSSPKHLPNMLCHSNPPEMRAGIVVYRMGRRPRHRGGLPHFPLLRAISPRAYPLGQLASPPSPSRWFAPGNGLFIAVGSDRFDRHRR